MRIKLTQYIFFDKYDYAEFKKFIALNDIKLKDLAKELGISCSYLTMIIKGERRITDKFYKWLDRHGYIKNEKTKIKIGKRK